MTIAEVEKSKFSWNKVYQLNKSQLTKLYKEFNNTFLGYYIIPMKYSYRVGVVLGKITPSKNSEKKYIKYDKSN